MNIIDIILGGLILFGAARGFLKGFFIEAASLLALILGTYGAIHFSYILGDYLAKKLNWYDGYIHLTAFVITFLIIVFAVTLLGKTLTRLMEAVALGILNRLAGFVFGAFKIALILGIVIAFFDRLTYSPTIVEPETIEKSSLYKPVKRSGEIVFYLVLRKEKKINDPRRDRL